MEGNVVGCEGFFLPLRVWIRVSCPYPPQIIASCAVSGFRLLLEKSTLRLLEGLDSAVSVDGSVRLDLGVRGLWSCCCGLLVCGEFGVGRIPAKYCALLSIYYCARLVGIPRRDSIAVGNPAFVEGGYLLKGHWYFIYLKVLYSEGLRPCLQLCTTHLC